MPKTTTSQAFARFHNGIVCLLLLNLGFYHIFLFRALSNEGVYGVVNQNLMSAVIMPKTSTPPVLRIA